MLNYRDGKAISKVCNIEVCDKIDKNEELAKEMNKKKMILREVQNTNINVQNCEQLSQNYIIINFGVSEQEKAK